MNVYNGESRKAYTATGFEVPVNTKYSVGYCSMGYIYVHLL